MRLSLHIVSLVGAAMCTFSLTLTAPNHLISRADHDDDTAVNTTAKRGETLMEEGEYEFEDPPWAIAPGSVTAKIGNPEYQDENCFTQRGRLFPKFFAKTSTYGGKGGQLYKCIGKWNRGIFIDKITVATDAFMVRRLIVRYTDGSSTESEPLGNKHGNHKIWEGSIEFNPLSDPWARFDIAEGGWAHGIGHIFLVNESACRRHGKKPDDPWCKLDRGRWWGPAPWDGADFKEPSRGKESRGMLLGIEGWSGDGIDQLTPLFSDGATTEIKISNFHYTPSLAQLNRDDPKSKMTMNRDYWEHENDTPNEAMGIYSMGISYRVGHRVTTGKDIGWDFGVDAGVSYSRSTDTEIAVPDISKVKIGNKIDYSIKFSVKHSRKTVNRDTTDEVKTFMYRHAVRVPIPAYHTLVCEAILMQSDLRLSFDATMTHRFAGGGSYNYPVSGEANSVAASHSVSNCHLRAPDEDPDRPEGANLIQTNGAEGSYCPNGSYAGPADMSNEDFARECGVDGIGDWVNGVNID